MGVRIPVEAKRFYDEVYKPGKEPEGAVLEGREEWERSAVEAFLAEYGGGGRLLEVGCGYAPYQDCSDGYVGIDISPRCAAYLRIPYAAASATALPFMDGSFRAVLTLHTLEHVHDPGLMLEEILRVLQPGGAVFLLPSWYVRRWAPQGLRARRSTDLTPGWKIVKILLPLLESPLTRALYILPRRLYRLAAYTFHGGPLPLRYRHIKANYERFLDSDSDACASIDPFDVMLFYLSRGCSFPDREGWMRKLLFRTGPLLVRKRGEGKHY
jgi:SAM-dependent methyltransferase